MIEIIKTIFEILLAIIIVCVASFIVVVAVIKFQNWIENFGR